jgi:CheY-like chemotaxis protein
LLPCPPPGAIALVSQWRPDIIVCDLGMPGVDGYEPGRRHRQAHGMERVMIAAVSGYGGSDDQ